LDEKEEKEEKFEKIGDADRKGSDLRADTITSGSQNPI
jgi:hypothetical protein